MTRQSKWTKWQWTKLVAICVADVGALVFIAACFCSASGCDRATNWQEAAAKTTSATPVDWLTVTRLPPRVKAKPFGECHGRDCVAPWHKPPVTRP